MYRSILSSSRQPIHYVTKRSFGGGHGHCHHTGKNAFVDKSIMRHFKDPASYPLLGALTVAVTAASYTVYRNLRYNPDAHIINRAERHQELKDTLRSNADRYYHHSVRDKVLQMAADKEAKAAAKAERLLNNKADI